MRDPLPPSAAWRHEGAREGFETVWFHPDADRLHVVGCTTAVEDGRAWAVEYRIELDSAGVTRSAHVTGTSATGRRAAVLTHDGHGTWHMDGRELPELRGCLDVDLESSSLTNAFPMRRLALAVGASADCPAAYVRALDLSAGRLDQTYTRRPDTPSGSAQYHYSAPAFAFTADLTYDSSGLVLTYPGIATRAA